MSADVIELLLAMEQELKALGCWKEMPPSPEAMASQVPFYIDTMAFTQWLQWFFIPRVRAIVDQGAGLPKGANIKPYAEEALRVENVTSEKLMALVERFDELTK